MIDYGMDPTVTQDPRYRDLMERALLAIPTISLVTNPAILLADEPTGNLDSKTGAEILDLFDSLRSPKRALVTVTHDSALARRCLRIIALRNGRIEYDGDAAGCSEDVMHA